MSKTANLPNQETQEDCAESVTSAGLKQRIEELAQQLKLNLKCETLPRTLTIGAPKEIAGARIPELIKALNSSEAEFEENTAVLKSAADSIKTTIEELLVDPAFPNMWTTRAWRRTQLDLIAELKSILNLYCEHLARLAAKKAKEDEETREIAEIPEIPATYDGLIAAVKREFLERVAGIENRALKAIIYTVWEDFFDSAKKIIERNFRGKKNEGARLQIMESLTSADTARRAFSTQYDINWNVTDITIQDSTLRTFNCETSGQIAQLYVKALLLLNLRCNREWNQNNFWMTVSMIQALQNGSGTCIKRTESVPELEKATYPGDKFDVPHKKKKWREETAKRIAEQKELAASDSDFLDRISAVLEFLTETESQRKGQLELFGEETEAAPAGYADFLPFRAETKQTVSSAREAQNFKQKLSDVFNGNCSTGARRPLTSDDWREIALNARAAALKAIRDQWRARGSAKEAWAHAARETVRRSNAEFRAEEAQRIALEEQRRRCEIEAANATLQERLQRALENIDHGSTGSL